jgi:hypothetical protein
MSFAPMSDPFPRTPDGHYVVVRGRLWRLSNPALNPEIREALVSFDCHVTEVVRTATHSVLFGSVVGVPSRAATKPLI